MKKTGTGKRIASLALAAVMMVGVSTPASAATTKIKFTKSGNVYGVTTTSTGYKNYVTAWAKVRNKSNGKQVYVKKRAYRNSKASAKMRVNKFSYVERSGGYILG